MVKVPQLGRKGLIGDLKPHLQTQNFASEEEEGASPAVTNTRRRRQQERNVARASGAQIRTSIQTGFYSVPQAHLRSSRKILVSE